MQIEFVQFEQAQQESLREEIARLEELIAAERDRGKSAVHSILSSLQGLSDMFAKKKEAEREVETAETKVKQLWDHFREEADLLRAVLVSERERQRHKLQAR